MALYTFKKDVHIVDREAGVDSYFNVNDTVEVSKNELKLVDAYAKRWKLEGDVYVAGDHELREEVVAPRPDSPSAAKADDKK